MTVIDGPWTATPLSRRLPAPTLETAAKPPERAQLVWRRALELAGTPARHERHALALDLLHSAHHDPATMAHALTLGRTHLRDHDGDAVARGGTRILVQAMAFLGLDPSRGQLPWWRRR